MIARFMSFYEPGVTFDVWIIWLVVRIEDEIYSMIYVAKIGIEKILCDQDRVFLLEDENKV